MIIAQNITVPAVDPIGLPAAPGWMVFFMLLTLVLHFIFMNFVLGGNLIALGLNTAALFGSRRANPIATAIYQAMPPAISMAITMGVAPLLFVQVLYGPYFYSANVLLGLSWFSFVVVLMAVFYLTYWLTYRGSSVLRKQIGAWDNKPGRRFAVSLLVCGGFLWIAWILTSNHELSIQPELWGRNGQWQTPRVLVESDTMIFRFLHDIVGMTAIAGIWVAAIGWWRYKRIEQDQEVHVGMIRLGLILAAIITVVQLAVGIIFFLNLGEPIWKQLMGFKSAFGAVWTMVLLAAITLPMVLGMAAMKPQRFKLFALAAGLATLVLSGMLIGREQVRRLFIERPAGGEFTLDKWAVYPQTFNMIIFLLVLVAGLATVALMLWWIIQGRPDERKGELHAAPGEPSA